MGIICTLVLVGEGNSYNALRGLFVEGFAIISQIKVIRLIGALFGEV